MARKAKSSADISAIGLIGGLVAVVLLVAAAIYFIRSSGDSADEIVLGDEPCLPSRAMQFWGRDSASSPPPGSITVYVDKSGGMAGYAAGSQVFGNLITVTDSFSRSSPYSGGEPADVEFRTFGEYSFDASAPAAPPLVENPRDLGSPDAYREQDTRIADILDWVAHSNETNASERGQLSLIVTDLMLDDDQAIDEFAASVGGRLRNLMIDENLAVAFLGVRVPFTGKIYIAGLQGNADVNIRARPLIVMMIGDPYHVRTYYDYLRSTDLQPFSPDTPVSNHAFSVFGLEPSEISSGDVTRVGIDSGFEATSSSIGLPASVAQARLRTYRFDSGTDADAEGGLRLDLAANANVAEFEVIGDEPYWFGDVWRLNDNFDPAECATGTVWLRTASLPNNGMTQNGQDLSYMLSPAVIDQLGLDEGTYLFQIAAGQMGLIDNHPSAEWMQEWSMSNREIANNLRRSRRFPIGTPGLEPLRRNLLNELLMPGREQVERSVVQMIVTIE